jgi:MoaA/NifB/PqqE/SkfB family radical SAM enzyme
MAIMKERDTARFWSGESARLVVERPPLPKNMMVEITNACNHACIFCTNPHMTRKLGRIKPQLLYRVMEEAAANGVEEIGFYTTGDPFVHKDLAKFTAHAKASGFSYVYVSTNGALATPQRMKQVIDAGIDSIKFSINAGSREMYKLVHGADDWDAVVAHLRFAAEYRRTIGRKLNLLVTCVVTKQIEHETELLEATLGALVDEIYFTPCTNQISQMDGALPLLGDPNSSEARRQGNEICRLPFNRLHLTREGYLTLCCVDYQNYLAVADLNQMSLVDAWYCDAFVAQRRRHLERRLEGTLCGNCWLGRRDHVVPIDPSLATTVDFRDFHNQQKSAVQARLAQS